MNMRHLYTLLVLFLALICTVQAQAPKASAEDDQETTEELVYPRTGLRFVICSPTNARLPRVLYARSGEKFLPYYISSRMPSNRAKSEADGAIRLYESEPQDLEKLPEPYITIRVPSEFTSGRVLCIIVPGDDPKKVQTFFLKESDFAVGGFYIVNFSPATLDLFVSETPDMPEKSLKIAPFRRNENNSISKNDPNIWSIRDGSSPTYQYVLNGPAMTEGGEPLRIRSAALSLRKDICQMCIVVRHPKQKHAFRLISVQFNNETDKARKPATPAPGAAPRRPSSSGRR